MSKTANIFVGNSSSAFLSGVEIKDKLSKAGLVSNLYFVRNIDEVKKQPKSDVALFLNFDLKTTLESNVIRDSGNTVEYIHTMLKLHNKDEILESLKQLGIKLTFKLPEPKLDDKELKFHRYLIGTDLTVPVMYNLYKKVNGDLGLFYQWIDSLTNQLTYDMHLGMAKSSLENFTTSSSLFTLTTLKNGLGVVILPSGANEAYTLALLSRYIEKGFPVILVSFNSFKAKVTIKVPPKAQGDLQTNAVEISDLIDTNNKTKRGNSKLVTMQVPFVALEMFINIIKKK